MKFNTSECHFFGFLATIAKSSQNGSISKVNSQRRRMIENVSWVTGSSLRWTPAKDIAKHASEIDDASSMTSADHL